LAADLRVIEKTGRALDIWRPRERVWVHRSGRATSDPIAL